MKTASRVTWSFVFKKVATFARKRVVLLTVGLAFSTGLVSCAAGPCRQLRQPERATQQPKAGETMTSNQPPNQPPGSSPSQSPAQPKDTSSQPTPTSTPTATPSPIATILVYKEDGSLQCGQAKGLSVQEMEKQLSGIRVFSRDKRSDGLMHIQACGTPTGMINVYEIPASQLAQAEAKGFRKLEPR